MGRWLGMGSIACAITLLFAAGAAAAPVHLRTPGLDLDASSTPAGEFKRPCGVAVDSEGDRYVASGDLEGIDVFAPDGAPDGSYLTTIHTAEEPCGLAVDSQGRLYTAIAGDVWRYSPNAYPFAGTPTYGAPVQISEDGNAEGIAVDPADGRLYVAKGDRISVFDAEGNFGVDEAQSLTFNSASGGTFRLALPGEGGPGRDEVQQIDRTHEDYKLTFQGQTTPLLEEKASATTIEEALEGLSTIGAGNVSVVGLPKRPKWVEFTGALADSDVALITSSLGAGSVQAVSDKTGPIALGASAAEVEAALEALQGVGVGNVAVETAASGYRFDFQGALAHTNVPKLAASSAALVPDGSGFEPEANTAVIAEGFSGEVGLGELTEATSVAAYTYGSGENARHYVFAGEPQAVQVLAGTDLRTIGIKRTIDGAGFPDQTPAGSFELPTGGGGLFADPGSCPPGKHACAAGHLMLYDHAHETLLEFEANGQFLDRTELGPGFADAGPSAIAVDRSGGASEGTVYLSEGPGAGAQVLAFGPLVAPQRFAREALSQTLANAVAVAVDSEGDVYVAADTAVYVFGSDGALVTQFEDPQRPIDLDVDASGRVYVLDNGPVGNAEEVTYYTPTSYPPGPGTSYERHEPAIATEASFPPGELLRGIGLDPASGRLLVAGSSHLIELGSAEEGSAVLNADFAGALNVTGARDVAVCGGSGEVFIPQGPTIAALSRDGGELLARIDGRGSAKGPFSSLGLNPAVAVDQSNCHLVVFDNRRKVAEEYEPSGAFVAQFGSFSNESGASYRVAVDNGATSPNRGDAFVAFDDPTPGTFDLSAFSPLAYSEVPDAKSAGASGVGGGKATLNGSVNPNGFAVTECHFEYTTAADFQANGFSGSPQSAPCSPDAAAIGSGQAPVAVHADLEGLDPEGRYYFRLFAANEFGASPSDAKRFGALQASTAKASGVLYREATLRGSVDPWGLETEYRFEYGEAPGNYEFSTPMGKLDPGAPQSDLQAGLTELKEGTTYYFRLLAENEAGPAAGAEGSFTTLQRSAGQICPNTEYRTGLSAGLPDCRAYELVSPADTHGARLVAGDAGSPDIGFDTWLVSPRGVGAGEALSFFSTLTLPGFEGSGFIDGYLARRGEGDHPSEGWQTESLSPSFSLSGGGGALTRYGASDQRFSLWHIQPAESLPGSLPEGLYLRRTEGEADPLCAPAASGFEAAGCGPLGVDLDAKAQFLSPGAKHILFSSAAHLQAAAPPAGTTAIYDREYDPEGGAASARVVSLLPADATPAGPSQYVGANEAATTVLFETAGALYARLGGEETVEVTGVPGAFAGVSEDGEHVFLESAAGLYACDLAAAPCEPGTAIAPAGSHFVNVSPDGTRAYFTSNQVLDDEGAGQAAKDNLYLWEGASEAISFVAVLDPADLVAFGGNQRINLLRWAKAVKPGDTNGLAGSPSRATPDGGVLVFQSHAQLTSYENEGKSEVYRYEPGAPSAQRLTCLSCSPSNAPAVADATLQDIIAPAPAVVRTRIPNLTDDGSKVFFQSTDRLLPEDANNVQDVYEWKAAGIAGCEREGGCLALISSGQGEGASYLFSMTADGHDVFFTTQEKLVGADVPGSPSIYDAREEGGIPDPPLAAPCQGDACQGQGSAPPALAAPPGPPTLARATSLPARVVTARRQSAASFATARCAVSRASTAKAGEVTTGGEQDEATDDPGGWRSSSCPAPGGSRPRRPRRTSAWNRRAPPSTSCRPVPTPT